MSNYFETLSDRELFYSILKHDLVALMGPVFAVNELHSLQMTDPVANRQDAALLASISGMLWSLCDKLESMKPLPAFRDFGDISDLRSAISETGDVIGSCLALAERLDPRLALHDHIPWHGEKNCVRMIFAALSRCAKLVEGMQRLFQGGDPAVELLDARCEIEKALMMLDGSLLSRNATISIEGKWSGKLRHGVLLAIVQNLLSNAIGHNPSESPQVWVEVGLDKASDDNRGLRCVVADNGPGIAAADIWRIFRPGFSTTGSLGIGLSIAARLSAKAGGRLELAHTSDVGSKFLLRLPRETSPD